MKSVTSEWFPVTQQGGDNMGIEDRIDKIERELNKKMPDKVYSGGYLDDVPVGIPVNRLFDLILEKLDVQVIHTPQGFEFGPRPKDEE